MRYLISRNEELKEILVADLVLSIAFDLAFNNGMFSFNIFLFLYFLPIFIISTTLTFVLHELMHREVAQRFFGAIAAFRYSEQGLVFTFLSSLFGFFIGLPGATVIYDYLNKREEGIVSLAGPLTNFIIFFVFFAIGISFYPNFINNITTSFSNPFKLDYIQNMINITLYISLILAFFNMLPIYPLDGSKIFRWNKFVYLSFLVFLFLNMSYIIGLGLTIAYLIIMLFFALFSSILARAILI